MPIKPNPYRVTYEICGYTRINSPMSDSLTIQDLRKDFCPKCDTFMKKSIVDKDISPIAIFKNLFK